MKLKEEKNIYKITRFKTNIEAIPRSPQHPRCKFC